nr:MAG TPA: hypothetical protein [Caudoviricetes sp.]
MTANCRSKGWALWANICAKKSESLIPRQRPVKSSGRKNTA